MMRRCKSFWQPGDQPPSGYLAWHSWAEVQHKAGLRPARCGVCSLWKFPQELSNQRRLSEATDRRGNVHRLVWFVCNGCVKGQVT